MIERISCCRDTNRIAGGQAAILTDEHLMVVMVLLMHEVVV